MPYRELDPRTELEQVVAADLDAALGKRGATVVHYGKAGSPAPAAAPCDISFEYGPANDRRTVMVEVAQRNEASEFQSIVSHLENWEATKGGPVDLLYSGRATSARMARLVRNENERRASLGLAGRIIFLKLDDLEAYLARWAALPASEAPIAGFARIFDRHKECIDDLASAEVFRQCIFPEWQEKADELNEEVRQRLLSQQERLKKDIQALENKLRESGVTGPRAHKYLIYLFFMALYEDKRGMKTRATRAGFIEYRESMSNKDKVDFQDRTVHHLISQNILEDDNIKSAGIPRQYEKIDLSDAFVLKNVIPVFENYSFSDASIDAIGAVFEALARRAEKDNRIGQFFTPDTAVAATCRLAGIRPTDLVADPACGTGRFLIHAMAIMSAQAHAVTGSSRNDALKAIRQDLLLGSDIDPWIAIIAKMNMYINGDGKSNIRHANGLALATVATFSPEKPKPLANSLDIVVTNPPLGDIDFVDVSESVARSFFDPKSRSASEEDIHRLAAKWSSENLDVVPHTLVEEEIRAKATTKANEWRIKLAQAEADCKPRAIASATKRINEWEAKRQAADLAIGSGVATYRPAGRTAKGGALFLSALSKCLKTVRDASLPVEWRGGTMGIIIDEAVLNTPQYASARAFIRSKYYIKAIVSLPRDTFAELAKTTAKTSILLLVRKDDDAIRQREPIFFARAEKTGPVGRNINRENDLTVICDLFDKWRSISISACAAKSIGVTDESTQRWMHDHIKDFSGGIQISLWKLDPELPSERLDEAHWCKKDLIGKIASPVSLSDMADHVRSGRVPPEKDLYSFASVTRTEARVKAKGDIDTSYSAEALQTIKAGDILASGIDLVHGSVAVVGDDCDGMVVSKEYFILRAKEGIDPFWLTSLLRTKAVRRIIEGTVTGTSNRTRVESADVLMALPMPAPPTKPVQVNIGDTLRQAIAFQKSMSQHISRAEDEAAKAARWAD